MLSVNRPTVYQPFNTFVVSVQITPTQIFPQQTKADLIDSFTLSLDAGAANNVFIGDQGVTTANGLEIVAGGGPITFRIRNQWQQRQLQEPLIMIADTLTCPIRTQPDALPFIIWDLSQIFLVAIAITSVRGIAWRAQYV